MVKILFAKLLYFHSQVKKSFIIRNALINLTKKCYLKIDEFQILFLSKPFIYGSIKSENI